MKKDASQSEIKQAYKELSRKYHPDKNGGDDAKFVEIAAAYEVLSDDEKKRNYDRFGEEGVNGQHGGHGGGGGNPFDGMFGFNMGGHRQMMRRNTETTIDVSLKSMYKGENLDLTLDMQGLCDQCAGTGSADKKTHKCNDCGGSGVRIVKIQLAPGMFQQIQTHCEKCGGRGTTIKKACGKCGGKKVMRERREYHLYIEPGSQKKFDHVYHGEADKFPDGEPGDLIVHVKESKDGNMGYRRRGNNLFRTEVITEKEATQGGWSRDVPCLDGETFINISRPAGTTVSNGEVEVLKQHGMPIQNRDDEHGDLYIKYAVILVGGNKKAGSKKKDEL